MILEKVPEKYYEIAGVTAGLSASAFILLQVIAEIRSTLPSTLSLSYVFGFLVIFVFWGIYGLRFKRIAIWLTNFLAALLQAILLAVILLK